MLYSRGVSMESLGVPTRDGTPVEQDPRKIWQRFADHYHLFRGTPTGAWFDHELHDLFGIRVKLDGELGAVHLRPDRRALGVAGVSSAGAVRAIQHRGARDDRPGERSARRASRAFASRAGAVASFRPFGPTPSSASRRPVGAPSWTRSPARHRRVDHRSLIVRRRARGPPPVLQVARRHGDRPRGRRAVHRAAVAR